MTDSQFSNLEKYLMDRDKKLVEAIDRFSVAYQKLSKLQEELNERNKIHDENDKKNYEVINRLVNVNEEFVSMIKTWFKILLIAITALAVGKEVLKWLPI